MMIFFFNLSTVAELLRSYHSSSLTTRVYVVQDGADLRYRYFAERQFTRRLRHTIVVSYQSSSKAGNKYIVDPQ